MINNLLKITLLTLGFLLVQYQIAKQHFSYSDPVVPHIENEPEKFSGFKGISPRIIEVLNKKWSEYAPLTANKVLTIIDFNLPSYQKRLWTIDVNSGEVLIHSLVAHGKNSGELTAENFSNSPQSLQSSLGFYLTEKPYFGKHGYSLRLKGMEKDINDKAFERAIVVHSADYVSEDFIKQHGRLGRSFGCPALPKDINEEFINTTKEGSLLFIFHDSYLEHQ